MLQDCKLSARFKKDNYLSNKFNEVSVDLEVNPDIRNKSDKVDKKENLEKRPTS